MSKTIRGRILYTSNKSGREGQPRGMEHFAITINQDGTRSLRSHCVIQDPPMVERDVMLSVDANFHPKAANVRIRVGDEQEGMTRFFFNDRTIEARGHTLDGKPYSEDKVLDKPATFFVTHPIQADAWLLAGLGVGEEPAIFPVGNFPTSSNDHRGATGPQIEIHERSIDIYFLGREPISVAAGEFEAFHFCYGDPNENPEGSNETGVHPRYHVWTSTDGNFVLLRARVDGYMQTNYELQTLSMGDTGSI